MSKNYRTCDIVKTDNEEFEFFLQDNQPRGGQTVTMVLPGGPADKAGLQNGDRIIEINGESVENKAHYEVVDLIQENIPSNKISFVVIAEKDDVSISNDVTKKLNGSTLQKASKPRLCKVKKKKKSFGFQLATRTSNRDFSKTHVIKVVEMGSSAAKSGLRKGDRLIEINKQNVEKSSHADIVKMIKKSGKKVLLLVVDEATYEQFTLNKTEIKAEHAYKSNSSLPSSRSSSVKGNSEKNHSTAPAIVNAVETSPKAEKSPLQSPESPVKTPAPALFESVRSFSPKTSDSDKPRVVHVMKAADEQLDFTFYKSKEAIKGIFVRDLKIGKLGFRNGLMENDLVLSVNGKIALPMSVEEVQNVIKANPYHVLFVVLGPKAVDKAVRDGLSSLLRRTNLKFLEKPRTITMQKHHKGGYGFFLKTEKATQKHIFDDVEKNGPAEKSNLKNGDMLVSIGTTCVIGLAHKECIGMIKAFEDKELVLTVGKRDTVDALYNLDFEVTSSLLESWPALSSLWNPELPQFEKFFQRDEDSQDNASQPPTEEAQMRTCCLKKINGAFGFFLNSDAKHTITRIEEGGAAKLGGILEYDRILEINGVNVESEAHSSVIDKINESGNEMTLLVIKGEERSFISSSSSSSSMESMIDLVTDDSFSYSLPRYCLLREIGSGFGFKLETKDSHHVNIHLITGVNENGIAFAAGVREGDILIAVNDVNVQESSRSDVESRIAESGSSLSLLVVDEKSELYYRKTQQEITSAMAVATMIIEPQKDDNSQFDSSSSESESCASDLDSSAQVKTPLENGDDEEDKIKPEEVLKEFDSVMEELREDIDYESPEEIASARAAAAKARKGRLHSGLDDIHEEPEENSDDEANATSSSDESNDEVMIAENQLEAGINLAAEIEAAESALFEDELKKEDLVETEIAKDHFEEKLDDQANLTVAAVITEASKEIKSSETNNILLATIVTKQFVNEKQEDKEEEEKKEEEEEEEEEKNEFNYTSSIESSSSDSSSDESENESKNNDVITLPPEIDFPPPPPLLQNGALPPPKPPRQKTLIDISVTHAPTEEQSEKTTESSPPDIPLIGPTRTTVNLVEVAKALKPVKQKEEGTTTFTVDPSGETVVQKPSNLNGVDVADLLTFNDEDEANHQMIIQSRDFDASNEVSTLEKSNEINWSGNGMRMKIIESSTFQ